MAAQKKILILAANPRDTTRLRLDEEVREIKEGLRLARKRDLFEIEQQEAVRIRDLRRALLDCEPQIVHFSGHGEADGIVLEDETGNSELVEPGALASLFELFSDQVECVLLNACFSESQAKAINKHIPYVIGMKREIGDRAAIEFAVGFYDALGAGKTFEQAFKFGRNAIQLKSIPEHLTPVLKINENTNARQKKTSFRELDTIKNQKKQRIKKQIDDLMEEINALSNQLNYAINASDRIRLERQIESIEKEVELLENRLFEIQ